MSARVRRADRVKEFLETQPGFRARVGDIAAYVAEREGREELSGPAISIVVRRENERLDGLGEPAVFRFYPESEEWGWVALSARATDEGDHGFANLIRRRNEEVKQELGKRLEQMDWRAFESTFLTQVLEALGFQEVEITQATRDGGVDARVTYQRGLVQAQAIVSAKHWKNRVPVDEVRKVRGIKGSEDTAIIVTSGSFSGEAQREAEPGQNQRAVYLIDGKKIVDICRTHNIGIRKVSLPDLLTLDEEPFAAEANDPEPKRNRPTRRAARRQAGHGRRLRMEMLGDRYRGLSAEDIARLLGLGLATVRSYLSVPNRKQGLFERLRADHRDEALAIVARKRG